MLFIRPYDGGNNAMAPSLVVQLGGGQQLLLVRCGVEMWDGSSLLSVAWVDA